MVGVSQERDGAPAVSSVEIAAGVTPGHPARFRKIQQSGSLLKVGPTSNVGEFYNPGYDISGRVRVVVKGATQTVTFQSGRGKGSVSLRKQ